MIAHRVHLATIDEYLAEEARLVSQLNDIQSKITSIQEKIDKARRSRIPQLNGDVVEIIFEHVNPRPPTYNRSLDFRRTDDWYVKYRLVFRILCLVSRTWLAPARRFLYRVIPSWTTIHQIPLSELSNTIRNTPAIRPLVRELHARISGDNCISLISLVEFLPACDVFVHSYSIPQKLDIVDIFIRWERICFFRTKEPLAWAIAAQNWSRLIELQLSGQSLHDVSYRPRTIPNPGFPALQKLILHMLSIECQLPSMTYNTLHTLIIASVSFPTTSYPVELIQDHHLSLRRIYLQGVLFRAGSHATLDDIGTYVPNLESLYISNIDSFSTNILSSLPPTVTDVTVEFWTTYHKSACIDFLHKRVEKSSRLAKLHVVAYGETSTILEWDGVVDQAAQIGVEFGFVKRHPNGGALVFQVGARQPALPSWAEFVVAL